MSVYHLIQFILWLCHKASDEDLMEQKTPVRDWMLQKYTLLKAHYALKMGVEWKQYQGGQAWAFWSMVDTSYILHVL